MNSLLVIRDPAQAVALLDPLRQRMLIALREPGSGASLSRLLGQPRQAINYHLKTLEKLGLIEFREERAARQMKERLYQTTALRFMIDPAVLGALAPNMREITDPTSSSELAALLCSASAEALVTESPTLAQNCTLGFVDKNERIAAFQAIANTAQKLTHTHLPQGTDEQYRVVIGVVKRA